MLEAGEIPHAYKTEPKPRLWRIPASEASTERYEAAQKARNSIGINKNWLILVALVLVVVYFNSSDDSGISSGSSYSHNLVGKSIPYHRFEEFGKLETLTGTNNERWVVYFGRANFTMITNKQTDKVVKIKSGRKPFNHAWSNY